MQIIPEYSLLSETVELLYKFVNNQTFDNIRRNFYLRQGDRLSQEARAHYDAVLDALEVILEESTRDLERSDARLQHFFRNLQPDAGRDWACLAQILLCSFYDREIFDFDESVAECRRKYEQTVRLGWEHFRLLDIDRAGISFVPLAENEQGESLFRQLDACAICDGCKWTIYKALSDYDASVAELITLMRPIAQRLETVLRRFDDLREQTIARWQAYFAEHGYEECKLTMMGVTSEQAPPAPRQIVCFWWLGCNQMHYYQDEKLEVINAGMLICPGVSPKGSRYTREQLMNILKILGDSSKFEILRKLSGRSCYGLELANEMQLTSGTISKHLNALFSCGLIDLQRVNNRVYYQTDEAAVRRVLKQLEDGLLGKESS